MPDVKVVTSQKPKTFEEMNISYGYVLYETIIPANIVDPSILYAYNLRDRACVYVNKVRFYLAVADSPIADYSANWIVEFAAVTHIRMVLGSCWYFKSRETYFQYTTDSSTRETVELISRESRAYQFRKLSER